MLSGSHEDCQRIYLDQKPSKNFIIGSLADYSKDNSGSPTGASEVQAKSALKHNSMAIMFLIEKGTNHEITISPSCSVFYKVFPTYKEQLEYINQVNSKDMYESIRSDPGFKVFYKRKDCQFNDIKMQLNPQEEPLDFKEIIKELRSDPDLYRTNKDINVILAAKDIKNHFDVDWTVDQATYDNQLIEIKKARSKKSYNWTALIELEREEFDKKHDLITIRFSNTTHVEKPKFEVFLFNCILEIELKGLVLKPFEYTFKHEGFNYKEQSYLRTLNCHAKYDGSTRTIQSQSYAIHYQLKKVPRISINGIKANFNELKTSIKSLEDLLAKMQDQHSNFLKHAIFNNDSHLFHDQFKKETKNFERIIERFTDGISIFKSNSDASKAFGLMNEVFELSSSYDGWRIFQIVFIVMLIPDIVDLKKNRSIADVIHVNTGGGKSEAYFGLVVFLLFWDRLRGKAAGVSAISKFPLRMLSIQQLQRIAKIIVLAEEVRKNNKIKGKPFSVGYYVGVSDDFPRQTLDKIQEIKNCKSPLPGVLLDKCPICECNIILEIDKNKHSVIHACSNPKCSKKYYLYFTNSEVYRFLPSLIVSTVDKLASVALNRRFKNLLGGKLSICPKGHGFSPINDACDAQIHHSRKCQETTETYGKKIEGPTLMIQDEMHLLREGFGTIDSHFESLLNTLLKKFSQKEFKYVSMTATVSGAKDQIDHLYGKELFIFPGNHPRGYSEEKDFFFEYEYKGNNKEVQRILIGLKPNLRDNQYASLLTIHHIANFLKTIIADKTTFSKKTSIPLSELENELKKYQCLLTYHGKKADVFGMNYFMHTVVTSKINDFDVIGKPLTGDNTLTEIKDTIKVIENFPDSTSNEKKIHSTFATSVVSHGVDIDNWNIMIFQGITRDTSEYIQALSRAGRKYTGLIFLWFYPNRVRDLSYYKNFNIYHNILQQKVERTPISRWTKLGFKQTFTSVFCGAILNYMSDILETPLYKVDDVNDLFSDITKRDELKAFIKEAYYVDMPRLGSTWIKDRIGEEVDDRLNYLITYGGSKEKFFFPAALRKCGDKYFKTQYGMRGIQEEITLKLNDYYTSFVKKYIK